jgi:DNA invertase Pin-like site-specific DNA recombinase
VLVVWKLDGLGRSLLDLVALVETLQARARA